MRGSVSPVARRGPGGTFLGRVSKPPACRLIIAPGGRTPARNVVPCGPHLRAIELESSAEGAAITAGRCRWSAVAVLDGLVEVAEDRVGGAGSAVIVLDGPGGR